MKSDIIYELKSFLINSDLIFRYQYENNEDIKTYLSIDTSKSGYLSWNFEYIFFKFNYNYNFLIKLFSFLEFDNISEFNRLIKNIKYVTLLNQCPTSDISVYINEKNVNFINIIGKTFSINDIYNNDILKFIEDTDNEIKSKINYLFDINIDVIEQKHFDLIDMYII